MPGSGEMALAFGSGLKLDVDSCRCHSVQESAKFRPMHPAALSPPACRPASQTKLLVPESNVNCVLDSGYQSVGASPRGCASGCARGLAHRTAKHSSIARMVGRKSRCLQEPRPTSTSHARQPGQGRTRERTLSNRLCYFVADSTGSRFGYLDRLPFGG